jgi:hypothetical protein
LHSFKSSYGKGILQIQITVERFISPIPEIGRSKANVCNTYSIAFMVFDFVSFILLKFIHKDKTNINPARIEASLVPFGISVEKSMCTSLALPRSCPSPLFLLSYGSK